jgi:phosphomannomutase
VRDWSEATYGPLEVDTLDGMTLTKPGPDGQWLWWLNLRASNTEPLLRLNVEARDEATMRELRDAVLAIVRA